MSEMPVIRPAIIISLLNILYDAVEEYKFCRLN